MENLWQINPTSNWYPPSIISIYAELTRDKLASSKKQLHILEQTNDSGRVLDSKTIQNLIKLYSSENKDSWIFIEQCKRWRKNKLTREQFKIVREIENNVKQFKNINKQILFFITHLRGTPFT